jgi:hypothetical protein
MFIDKNSIVINNVNFGQYITNVEYQYNKLWGSDSGRNLAGEQSGTLLGVFPKFVLSFRKLTPAEMELLVPIFDSAVQNFTYYDPNKKTTITIQTYTGDYSYENNRVNGKNSSFNISFIATKARV